MILRLTLVGLIAAGLLGFGLLAWVATHPAAGKAEAPHVIVLAAAHAVQPGALLKPDDLAARKLPGVAPPGALIDTPKGRRALAGAMVRRSLGPNEIILPPDVLRPGDHGFLAAVLKPGMRAITVGVDLVSGTAGLIWPGDRVDLILTQATADPAVPPDRRVSAETVLADVRVIAIDQRLVEGAKPGSPAGHAVHTVTLEVTAEEAERVAVATRLGRLSLSVRAADPAPGAGAAEAAAPGGRASKPAAVWAGDVAQSLAIRPVPAPAGAVRVWQGTADGKEIRF
ncbi:MAG: Flp pilus assembly protein CpaB [Proteobacteria bacterium]|nr:Flp pilus assembly protein CpaB [Pseudomonadota bacterium]